MARITLVLAALALLTAPAPAAAATALETLQRMSSALTADGTVRYDCIMSDAPDLRDADVVVRSKVLARFSDFGALDAATVDSNLTRKSASQRGRLALRVVGEDAQLLDYINKQEHRKKTDELVAVDAVGLGALPLYLPMFFSSGAGLLVAVVDEDLELEGPVRDGREECMVVRGTFGDNEMALFVSTDDDMPRRLDIVTASNTMTLRFNRLRTGVPATDRSFEIRPAPRGFTTVRTRDAASGSGGAKPSDPNPRRSVGVKLGDLAPDWTLADEKGRPHSLSDYRGEVVLMDFWATWCPPCRAAMPGLQRLHEELENEGLNVLGVNTSERSPDLAPGFMKSNSYTYQLLLSGDHVAREYDVKGLPTFYVIGTEGEILFKGTGYSQRQELEMEQVIREALGLAPRRLTIDELDGVDIDDLER